MKLVSAGPRACSALAVVLLTGCIAVPADRGRADVDAWVSERGRQAESRSAQEMATLVRDAVRQPLSVDDSVRVALSQNPDLRATYSRLGLASADFYEAGRLSNPRLSAAQLDSSVSGERLTLGLVQSFTDLLLLPARSQIGAARFVQLQQSVAHAVLDLAARAEESHYRLVAAQQIAAMRDLVATTARTSADLAQRFHAAGNLSQLQLARERAAASEARLAGLAAHAELAAARAAHARVLGLAPLVEWSLQRELASPLDLEEQVDALVALALASRLDLAAARRETETLADAERLARRYRWLGEIDIGIERETDGARLTGPTLELELPLFNLRSQSALRAGGELEQARARLAALELDVAHEVRRAHLQMFAARGRAVEFGSVLIPEREAIVARTQEQQNYMLVGQFELLAAKQAEYDSYQGYLESVRDYWLARAELKRVVGARLPGTPAPGKSRPAIIVPRPQDASGARNHSGGGAP